MPENSKNLWNRDWKGGKKQIFFVAHASMKNLTSTRGFEKFSNLTSTDAHLRKFHNKKCVNISTISKKSLEKIEFLKEKKRFFSAYISTFINWV